MKAQAHQGTIIFQSVASIVLRFHRTLDHHHFFLSYLPLSRSTSLIICRLHRTASFFSLIPYHPYRQSSLVLSSGGLLIALSVWWLLSCTIHRPTKQCYCRLGLCPLALVALPTQGHLRVYKLYHYSTWTLSLSSCAN